MKLKKKLILIVSLITAVSLVTGGVILMLLIRSSLLRDAYSEAAVSSMDAYVALQNRVETKGEPYNDESLMLVYKGLNNWRNVVYKGEKEIYNITVFGKEELDRVARWDDGTSEKEEAREELAYDDGLYIVNSKKIGDYRLYHLYDITDVYIRIRSMILNYTFVALGVLVLAVLITAFAVRKVLKPLEAVTRAAGDMADGDYSRRVTVETRDELGELAVHFNEMAEAVEQNARTMRESERRKTLMMGGLAHELKTPMTAVAGYAETLLTTKLSEEQKEEALYYIYTETNRLGRLSNKMMQLMNLSEGEGVEKTDVQVEELFHDIGETMSVKYRERGVKLVIEPVSEGAEDTEENRDGKKSRGGQENREGKEIRDGQESREGYSAGSYIIRTDGDLIREVLINLLDNAVKASHEGGKVWLCWKDGILSVRDEGIGIPAEDLEAVTEPFYMVDKSRSRKEGGAGLGLTLTKLILEKLGALMEIQSEPGKGTEIRIRNLV